MSSSSLKNELADHIYQYLCHEAQYSDLPEAARESLTAASECIEQAYKLNVNTNNNNNTTSKQSTSDYIGGTKSSDILPDALLRIFTRHKEFLLSQQQQQQQQKDFLKYPLRNESESSSSMDKPDIKLNSNPLTSSNLNDSHNSGNPNNINTNTNLNNATIQNATSSSGAQMQQTTTTKHHSQHPISQLPMTTRKKLSHLRAQIKRQASKAARSRLEKRSSVSGVGQPGGSHHRHSPKEFDVSVHQKNFKQKLIALLKKFRTDGSDFDSEEQYREALERELMEAAAGRGSRAIEELLEEDIDVEEESGSESGDWDNISETSTPKPSLRPFFSSTTLDKI